MCRGFFFQAEDGIRDYKVTGVQTCALPICAVFLRDTTGAGPAVAAIGYFAFSGAMASGRLAGDGLVLRFGARRSEEHTSELQSPFNIVCRLLLVKKKK